MNLKHLPINLPLKYLLQGVIEDILVAHCICLYFDQLEPKKTQPAALIVY